MGGVRGGAVVGQIVRRRFWTEEQTAWLIALFSDNQSADVAFALSMSVFRVNNKAYSLGLHKTPEYLASPLACRLRRGDNVGAAYRFQKGQPAWNKGVPHSTGVSRTRFKRGQMPHNWKPVGHERINVDGYREVKIAEPKLFAQLHRLVWLSNFGRVPRGKIIVFKDRNKLNCDPSNLEAISRVENMRRNSYHLNYPKPVALAIQLKGALQRQINRRTGHANDRRSARTLVRNARRTARQERADGH